MKKGSKKTVSSKRDGMRAHYDFDDSKSRPTRFASRLADESGTIAVLLDPDVAEIFESAEAVNAFLRSAIAAMPSADSRKRRRRAS
jgi:hypothetical protein